MKILQHYFSKLDFIIFYFIGQENCLWQIVLNFSRFFSRFFQDFVSSSNEILTEKLTNTKESDTYLPLMDLGAF